MPRLHGQNGMLMCVRDAIQLQPLSMKVSRFLLSQRRMLCRACEAAPSAM